MRIQYFPDTETLYVQLCSSPVAETRDLNEDTRVDFDGEGNVRAVMFEHATGESAPAQPG